MLTFQQRRDTILSQFAQAKADLETLNSDIDAEKAVKPLLEIGFTGYLLIGSDADDFKKAIEVVINGGRYFSMGVAKIAQKYFGNN